MKLRLKIAMFLSFVFSSTLSADTYIYNYSPTVQVNYVNINNVTNNYNNSRGGEGDIEYLYENHRVYHLGDEHFRSRKWAPLHGQCFFIRFRDYGRLKNYYLSLRRYGTEKAAIFLNRKAIGYLPRQYSYKKRPNYWSRKEWIEIPRRLVREGRNSLAICASPVPHPEFPGDLDDFQIKDIILAKTNQ